MGELKKRKKLHNAELDFKKLLKRCLIFTLIFCIVSIIVTAIISLLFFNFKDPGAKVLVASLISLYLSSFVSGFILSKVNGQKYFAGGLLLGCMTMILTFIIACFISIEATFSFTSIIWRLLIPVFCILGSLLGVRREKKQPHRHKK